MESKDFFSAEKTYEMSDDDSVLVAHRLCESFAKNPFDTLTERVDYLRAKYDKEINTKITDIVSLVLDDLLALIEVSEFKDLKISDQLLLEYIETDIPLVTEDNYAPELECSFIKILKKIGVSKSECLAYYDLSDTDLEEKAREKASGIFELIDQVYEQ